jgi:hypothetical protein
MGNATSKPEADPIVKFQSATEPPTPRRIRRPHSHHPCQIRAEGIRIDIVAVRQT